jgi:hypothetical protein
MELYALVCLCQPCALARASTFERILDTWIFLFSYISLFCKSSINHIIKIISKACVWYHYIIHFFYSPTFSPPHDNMCLWKSCCGPLNLIRFFDKINLIRLKCIICKALCFTLLGMVEASNSSGWIDQRLGPALYKAKRKQNICWGFQLTMEHTIYQHNCSSKFRKDLLTH